jgi:hypothetical protein
VSLEQANIMWAGIDIYIPYEYTDLEGVPKW